MKPDKGNASSQHNDTDTALTLNTRQLRAILASSFIGTTIEYYDFILYSVAASIVFAEVFFGNLGPQLALFASFATLAVGFVLRPLGGLAFGHFGDRYGRKKTLVLSMILMGISTVGIGLLPTTSQIGVLAPILLILLRIVQGFSVGGEYGGAALMALEHSPQKDRGFAASFASAGGPAGAILATLAIALFTSMPRDTFLAWGWRIPFLLSGILVIVGLYIRITITETPIFERLIETKEKKKFPLFDVIRNHHKAVLVGFLATMGFTTCQGILTVWGVATAIDNGADQTWVLNIKALGAVVTLVITFLAARLSDRVGRRYVLIPTFIAGIVFAFPMLWLLESGTVWGFAIADILGNGIIQGFIYGPIAAYVTELFPTLVRYSGTSLSYQTASMVGGGFSPLIASGLVLVAGGGIWLVGIFWIAVFLAGMLAVMYTPEGTERALQ